MAVQLIKQFFTRSQSSIGKKVLMALSGLGLIGFVFAHLSGNLLIYGGPELLNAYAAKLKSQPTYSLLWVLRFGLLLFFVTHIINGISLTLKNKRAKAQKYQYSTTIQASLASRTMAISGLFLLFFILYHLSHFTLGIVDPQYLELIDANGHHDVYAMVVAGFSNLSVSIFYILSMFFLWLHLGHGGSSVWQSLGLNDTRYHSLTAKIGPIIATILFIGNCSIPIAVLVGWLQ